MIHEVAENGNNINEKIFKRQKTFNIKGKMILQNTE